MWLLSQLESAAASAAEPMAIPSQLPVQSQGGVVDAKPDSKQGRRGVQRRVDSAPLRVRGVRHDPPDAKKIAKALLELAREQMADKPGHHHDPNAISGESSPLPSLLANRPKPRRVRHLDQDQVQMLVQGYAAGATTYELGDRFGIDRRAVSAILHQYDDAASPQARWTRRSTSTVSAGHSLELANTLLSTRPQC